MQFDTKRGAFSVGVIVVIATDRYTSIISLDSYSGRSKIAVLQPHTAFNFTVYDALQVPEDRMTWYNMRRKIIDGICGLYTSNPPCLCELSYYSLDFGMQPT